MAWWLKQVMPQVRKNVNMTRLRNTYKDGEIQKQRHRYPHHFPYNHLETGTCTVTTNTHNASKGSFQSAALQCLGRMLHSEMQIMSCSLCRGQNHRASKVELCWITHTHFTRSHDKLSNFLTQRSALATPHSTHTHTQTKQRAHSATHLCS